MSSTWDIELYLVVELMSGVGQYTFILYYTLKYQKYTLYFKVWPFSLKYTFLPQNPIFLDLFPRITM